MIVLKIIGWVLLGILLLIVAALFVRVGVAAEYSDDGTSVIVKWLFLKIPLYPREKKEKPEEEAQEETPVEAAAVEKPEEPENPEENDKKKEKKKKPEGKESFLHLLYRTNGIDGILLLVHRIFSYLGSFFGDLLKGVVVDELQLNMACTKKNDAAETAIYYGEVCSVLFPMMGAVAAKCRIKKYDVNVYPDYLARFSRASFFVRLHITPAYFIGITVLLGVRMIFKVAGRMFVKIFLHAKDESAGNSDKKSKEKSVKV